MPIVTRSQSKKFVEAAEPKVVPKIVTTVTSFPKFITSYSKTEEEQNFIDDTKKMLAEVEHAHGKQAKMLLSLQIYNLVNDKLEKFLDLNLNRWATFGATAYNKTTEFYNLRKIEGFYDGINKKLVDAFTSSYMKARNMLKAYFNKPHMLTRYYGLQRNPFKEMYENIADEDTKIEREAQEKARKAKDEKVNTRKNVIKLRRSRRNIPVVNYTGMDSIEPESEYDGITDIWQDKTLKSDPNYNPEEDEAKFDYEKYKWVDHRRR